MHEWLSGGVSPCQGEGRGFESRLVLSEVGRPLFCVIGMLQYCLCQHKARSGVRTHSKLRA